MGLGRLARRGAPAQAPGRGRRRPRRARRRHDRALRRVRARVDRALPGPHVTRLPRIPGLGLSPDPRRPSHSVLRRRPPAAPGRDPATRRQGLRALAARAARPADQAAAVEVDHPPPRRGPARPARRRDGGRAVALEPRQGRPGRRSGRRGHWPRAGNREAGDDDRGAQARAGRAARRVAVAVRASRTPRACESARRSSCAGGATSSSTATHT